MRKLDCTINKYRSRHHEPRINNSRVLRATSPEDVLLIVMACAEPCALGLRITKGRAIGLLIQYGVRDQLREHF
jgi:hypothetical protein